MDLIKPCKKCGSTDRNDSGDCRQCQAERGATHYADLKERGLCIDCCKVAKTGCVRCIDCGAKSISRVIKRRQTHLPTRLAGNLRSRLNSAIKSGQKSGSAVRDLGCTVAELKTYLEKLFQPDMTWENWGRGHGKWNIDHIRPLVSFDLTNRGQFLVANHYTNLQPLWAEDNLKKGAREKV